MKIGVIIAMDIEYRQMRDAIGGETGRLGNNDIVLWRCGVGKVNAAVGTMRLIQQHHPDAIISTGLAGGIDPQIHVMDVLAASQSTDTQNNKTTSGSDQQSSELPKSTKKKSKSDQSASEPRYKTDISIYTPYPEMIRGVERLDEIINVRTYRPQEER